MQLNDALPSSWLAGVALVENSSARLDATSARALFERDPARAYRGTVEREFAGVLFMDDENRF
ncbi:MAG TPA: hypothetical protein VL400_09660, partial [Polyangiaceae bacterium]|nr:hypothetical protein [Polyangiaceae bacterium]